MTLIQALVAASAVTIIVVEITWFRMVRLRLAVARRQLEAEIAAFQMATGEVVKLVNDLRDERDMARAARGA